MLRASIKLLVLIGLAFLLIPFVISLPWPRTRIPADATLVDITNFRPGETRAITLHDGSTRTERVDHPRGHARRPLTGAELEIKFHTLVDPVLGFSRRTPRQPLKFVGGKSATCVR